MQDVITRLRTKKDDDGFTLIELLVVVVIIGVLVAIAVPVYLNYRQGAADKSAQSDVRGAISAVEQFYSNNNNTYPVSASADNAAGATPSLLIGATGTNQQTITLSDKTKLQLVVPTAPATTYKLCALNTGGSTNRWYLYDSAVGGSVQSKSSAMPATC
jgi:type IV pilus assembly protein PilA